MTGSYRKCLHCKRSVRVNLRGRLRTHVFAPQPALHAICPGSQQPPMVVLPALVMDCLPPPAVVATTS